MEIWSNLVSKANGFIEERLNQLQPPSVEEYFESRGESWDDSRFQFILSTLENIYGNVAALLTHISAMIASLGIILIVFDGYRVTQIFIFFEMMAYAVFAIICVYCIKFPTVVPTKHGRNYEKGRKIGNLYKQYLSTRYIYVKCLDGVILNTILFLITVFIHTFTLVLAM